MSTVDVVEMVYARAQAARSYARAQAERSYADTEFAPGGGLPPVVFTLAEVNDILETLADLVSKAPDNRA